MDRIEAIDREIAQMRRKLDELTGTKTEVYSRIVGYYRSLTNWNRGKREEYAHRRTFALPAEPAARDHAPPAPVVAAPAVAATAHLPVGAVSYELFVRSSCPRCPAMKEAASSLAIPGRVIDIDTDAGTSRAIALSIYATPTVVFFDSSDSECSRARSPEELVSVSAVAFA